MTRIPSTTDLILIGGTIRTLAGPTASAVALSGDRIVALGSDAEVIGRRDRTTEVVQLNGRLVLPAFTDAHIHFAGYALSRLQVDLKGVTSIEEAVRRVADRAALFPRGTWITGRGWAHDEWGGTLPTRHPLDAVTPGYPIALSRNDGHGLWVSGEALRIAGVTRDTPAPSGGEILRDANGEPSGVLTELAMDLVRRWIPNPSIEEVMRAVRNAQPFAHRAGLAAITCMESFATYQAYRRLHERGHLGLRIGMCLETETFEAEADLIDREGPGDAWLHWTQLKLFADGALNPRTAWMLEPYVGDPTNRGINVVPPEAIERWAESAARRGFACAVHAIGDAANRAVLDAFEATRPLWAPRGLRPRIEHAQTIAESDVARFGRLGVIASMQPIHCTQDLLVNDAALGSRARNAYPFRRLIDAGARLAFGSDAPVETFDVLLGLYAATARRRPNGFPDQGWYPEERISMTEAVAAYTTGAAWAEGEESRRGTIEVGKLADLVVLSRDIFVGDPEVLLETRVEGTIVGGAWAFRAF